MRSKERVLIPAWLLIVLPCIGSHDHTTFAPSRCTARMIGGTPSRTSAHANAPNTIARCSAVGESFVNRGAIAQRPTNRVVGSGRAWQHDGAPHGPLAAFVLLLAQVGEVVTEHVAGDQEHDQRAREEPRRQLAGQQARDDEREVAEDHERRDEQRDVREPAAHARAALVGVAGEHAADHARQEQVHGPGDQQGGTNAETEEPPRGADAEPDGAGGTGKADDGEGVAGERLATEDHEPPDGAGHDGDDRAGAEGVDHEGKRKQLAYVVDQVPAEVRTDDRWHVSARAGRRGRRGVPVGPRQRGVRRTRAAPRSAC